MYNEDIAKALARLDAHILAANGWIWALKNALDSPKNKKEHKALIVRIYWTAR